MSDLVKRARRTELYEGSGEESDLHDEMADCIEALERQIAAADKLEEAVTHEREMVCQDFGMQKDAATAVHTALTEYQATKERSDD